MRIWGPGLLAIGGLHAVGCYGGLTDGPAGGDEPVAEGGVDDDGDGDGDGGDDDGDDGEPADPEPESCVGVADVGASHIHRLTRNEYDRAVRALLGEETPLDSETLSLSDGKVGPFKHNANKPAALETVEDYQSLAEAASADAATRLDEIVDCDIEAAPCASSFIDSFGRQAYRRAVTAEEHDRLAAVFDMGAQAGLEDAYRLVIATVLQSPNFLYRVELGDGPDEDGLITLSSSEIATRLSFFMHGGPPDEALLAAADAGELDTAEGIEAIARDMLDDPRAAEALASFPAQWLGVADTPSLERDEDAFGDVFDDALWGQMQEQLRRVSRDVLVDGSGQLHALLTADYTFMTPELAELYDVEIEGDGDGDGWSRVELDPTRRSGVLTSAAFLAVTAHPDQTSPVLRGAAVRGLLFCTEPPPPPSDVDDTPPAVDPTLPTRERFDEHRANPACSGCHDIMDPIGYGFENYDPIGRYRTIEGGQPVDASGRIVGTDVAGEFTDAIDLIDRLAGSEDVARCVQTQVFRLSNGRSPSSADDCATDVAYEAFADSDYDLRELMIAIAASDAFRYRRVAELENADEPHE